MPVRLPDGHDVHIRRYHWIQAKTPDIETITVDEP
jgi:hypothetical protein